MTNLTKNIFGVISITVVAIVFFAAFSNVSSFEDGVKAAFLPAVTEAASTGGGGDGCGGCGGGNGGGEGDGNGGDGGAFGENFHTPAPVCTIWASPASITAGSNTTLLWNISNANAASINNGVGGVTPTNGSKTITPGGSTNYQLYVSGLGGSAFCNASVTVTTPPPPPAPPTPPANGVCTSFTASPTTVPHGGGNVTLNWSATNATGLTIDNGVGDRQPNGSETRFVSSNTTFNVTRVVNATANGTTSVGSACAATVSVAAPPVKKVPTCTLSANPTNVSYNGSTTLTWTSTNATSATLDNSIGSVAVNGSRSVTNITSNRNYTLTVTGPDGSATCSANITTAQEPNAPICDLYANRTEVEPGEAVVLNWNSSNAHSATLTDFGSVSTSGSYTVHPYNDRTYTLTVTGNGGTRTCSRNIRVRTTPVVHPRPSCTISVNPTSVEQGKNAVLQWQSYNAVSATISPLGGYIPLSGSQIVYPNQTTQYFMTVRNAYGESAICTASLGVYATSYPTPIPQPIVRQYVPVSYVPYTGTEDVAYVLGLIVVLLASVGGAATIYHKQLRSRA